MTSVPQEMNVENGSSHLIVGIIVESRNLTKESLSNGKLSFMSGERTDNTGVQTTS